MSPQLKQLYSFLVLCVLTTLLIFRKEYSTRFKESKNFFDVETRQYVTVHLPLIYIITPTVYRVEQIADLTRMSHTLRLVPRVHWILVEDKETKSENIEKLLNSTGFKFTHLAIKADFEQLKLKEKIGPNRGPHRGDPQRNMGLDWVTDYGELPSVFYLADDDNTYSLRLFEEMRFTRRVSVWPVGLVGGSKYETPIVKNGKVVDFACGWCSNRKFALDMAGFAVNLELLKRPNSPRIGYDIVFGHSETSLLEKLNVTVHDLEPRADNCTEILVWHTRTKTSRISATKSMIQKLNRYEIQPPEV